MRMDSNEVKTLLEKYWNCETSLEEEKTLRTYFRSEAPQAMSETAELFRYFEQQQKVTVSGKNFDTEVKKKIKEQRPAGKSVKMYFNYARIAAGVLVMVAAGYFVRLEVRKAYPPEMPACRTCRLYDGDDEFSSHQSDGSVWK